MHTSTKHCGLLHLHWETVGLQAAEEGHIVAVRSRARRDDGRRQLLRVPDQVDLRCMQEASAGHVTTLSIVPACSVSHMLDRAKKRCFCRRCCSMISLHHIDAYICTA